SGDWSAQFIANQKVSDGLMEADLVGLSVFAPFNVEPAGGVLSVNPPTLNFGVVPVDTPAEATFTITNTGGSLVDGAVTVAAPFTVVEGGTYSIPPGEDHVVRVSFTPTSPTTFRREATLSGGGGAIVVL